ncbi:DUF2529 domain-containing protein [Bacillus seohaeanensis]|jgi:uncharacterized phosphosugar-binding protein|uniref:DUF2529 domain-containing protein n=1 Tax=Bacillus seohaeanensis TaxID=284580 RepID=A0ABW5RTA5_9BACI
MLKMFTTQISGLFNRIYEKQEFEIEDGARLLAQAAVGEGTIYLKGFEEMDAITLEAIYGAEPLVYAKSLEDVATITEADRVLIVSRLSNDKEAVQLAKQLQNKGIPFVAISGLVKGEESLAELSDIHLDTKLVKGMLPGEELGERTGFPSSMAGLYLYFLLKFTLDEMLVEYND